MDTPLHATTMSEEAIFRRKVDAYLAENDNSAELYGLDIDPATWDDVRREWAVYCRHGHATYVLHEVCGEIRLEYCPDRL